MANTNLRGEDLIRHCGLNDEGKAVEQMDQHAFHRLIAFKLASNGFEVPPARNGNAESENQVLQLASDLFHKYAEQSRLLTGHLNPPDRRIQDFLDDALASTGITIKLPTAAINMDRYGMARQLSIPDDPSVSEFHNGQMDSYRLCNGVLHNPLNDRRTTKGVFHIADYGLPIPADKIKVPLVTYARLLEAALQPPDDLNLLPYTAGWKNPVRSMVSTMLRPLACPEVPNVSPEKRMEVRFFVPGGCVSNIDFVESIFGNAGDPSLPENDAGLDTHHWTGTSGCVILAPHIRGLNKKALGLPHLSDATDDQKATGMCWENEDDQYNNGQPFKITLRDKRGIMVTILADNYFGYCKKEVKTQIGLTANIFGLAEEEHAGGAIAFKSYSLGTNFYPDEAIVGTSHTFEEAIKLLGNTVIVHPKGYATDKKYTNIHILPQDMSVDLNAQNATWTKNGETQSIRVLPGHTYLHPSGYKIRLEKHPESTAFKLIGTAGEGTFCHKPSTVSGGGKSEISKSLNDAVIYGSIYIGDFEKDMALVKDILERDYSNCFDPQYAKQQSRSPERKILSMERSLGSVVKLLTPNSEYTKEHCEFIHSIPSHIRSIVFAIKRFYKPEWGEDYAKHFSVDTVNGSPGHELKLDGRKLSGTYLRVGHDKASGGWRTYKLRQDFIAASKVQMEDDITASIVVPRSQIPNLPAEYDMFESLKISQNCEWRLFQRPDDAILPGFDQQTEEDLAGDQVFVSNFKPIYEEEMRDLSEQVDFYEILTEPMKKHMKRCIKEGGVNICSAKPRIWNGQQTKNPRYLQVRPDVAKPQDKYLAELGTRLYRRIPASDPCVFPVAGVISGRRNNPPDEINGMKILPLCVFNPIHYQELPELFMDFVCSVTGKSPSTTGAGSEGALTKGPFNAINATADLNNTLVSMLLTGYGGFSSAAGYIGPNYKVDHDISLLIPEVWCRMAPKERTAEWLIKNGELEKIDDYEVDTPEGKKTINASRLGYRITDKFVAHYFGRVFDNPAAAINEDMLKPELQSEEVFMDGIENLCDAQMKSALNYFKDGTIKYACPLLKIVLHVMAYGHYEGKSIHDPEIRALFTREAMLKSDWYKQRLVTKQQRDTVRLMSNIKALEDFMNRPGYAMEAARLGVHDRLNAAHKELARVSSDKYLEELVGTLGADPIVFDEA
eukprot:CAMPEP_0171340910 /NCGR_PEP_ID=MMETSP0878-20121228/8857_1 /TAXON_ID=67004 /ORGANISM="Thalassiosira weissflogii, Strain CCMP1336" /LENGTH=1177 /DNA_ID=CAMNT_0011843033 /DNA_START=74 /DNA_END=3607 /DNA_ORIENTATION=+